MKTIIIIIIIIIIISKIQWKYLKKMLKQLLTSQIIKYYLIIIKVLVIFVFGNLL